MAGATPIVDTDVHHGFADESDLVPYLQREYVERYEMDGIPGGIGYGNMHLRVRDDLDERNRGYSPSPDDVRDLLLAECGIDAALLTGSPLYSAGAIPDTAYANALCRAFNDYTVAEWLDDDDRFYYAMAVNPADPASAADEIERLGSHSAVVAVLLPTSAERPYGDRRYDPIHAACADNGLVVALHLGGGGGGTNPYPPTGAGFPTYYVENRLTREAKYRAHLVSLVFQGTFERHPALTVAFLESGWAWVPAFRWRMDAEWRALHAETPWVERRPSDYLREHVRFNTQPVEEPETREQLDAAIEWMDGERTLMFATDFPHQDWDDPARTLTHLDTDVRRRVFATNAAETFGVSL